MSSPAQSSTAGPPLYRYVVISAAVLVAIIFVAMCFRSRLESRHARRTADEREQAGGGAGMREPRLFDAYLHDAGTLEAQQWEDMMPLSAENLGAPEGWPIPAGKEEVTGVKTMRVNVGVIVRMPGPLLQPERDLEEPPPYVELGVVEMLGVSSVF